MNRQTLGKLVKFMFAIMILAFLYVLLSSLSPNIDNQAEVWEDISKGQTVMRRFDGRRVWISHLSDDQLQILQAIPGTAIALNTGCELNVNYCIIEAAAERAGIELVYSRKRPDVMLKSVPWVGGFIDPSNSGIYDLLGRGYVGQNMVPTLETISR